MLEQYGFQFQKTRENIAVSDKTTVINIPIIHLRLVLLMDFVRVDHLANRHHDMLVAMPDG